MDSNIDVHAGRWPAVEHVVHRYNTYRKRGNIGEYLDDTSETISVLPMGAQFINPELVPFATTLFISLLTSRSRCRDVTSPRYRVSTLRLLNLDAWLIDTAFWVMHMCQ